MSLRKHPEAVITIASIFGFETGRHSSEHVDQIRFQEEKSDPPFQKSNRKGRPSRAEVKALSVPTAPMAVALDIQTGQAKGICIMTVTLPSKL